MLKFPVWHWSVVNIRPETDDDYEQSEHVGQYVWDEECVGFVRVAVHWRGDVDRDNFLVPKSTYVRCFTI